MLRDLVRAQLAVELLLYAGLGAWLHAGPGWGVPVIVLAALGTALAIRLAIVCTSTLLSYIFRSPRSEAQRIGPSGTLRLIGAEWRAMLLDNFVYLPFESIAVRTDAPAERGGPVPVLMVHGYLSNRGLLQPLIAALDGDGARVHTFNFRGLFGEIEPLVDQLEAEVSRVLSATGHARLVLVCHSMGGLVARTWLVRHGAARVARLVTVASPHHGTAIAALGIGTNARQMQRGSAFLRDLAAAEGGRGPACPTTSVYSTHDNLVAPQETSVLPEAVNIAIPGYGHVAIVAAPEAHQAVAAALREAGALPA